MSMNEFSDRLAYYGASRASRDNCEPIILADMFTDRRPPAVRWPVRNHEERTPIDSVKRAIIHARDGGRCVYCGIRDGQLVLDHIIPRSAFYPQELVIADRSDNLQSACWACNEGRSNFESDHVKRPGVVVRCFYCSNPEFLEENAADDVVLPYPVPWLVYCGRCGISNVADLSKVL
jgi:5-methylcytosine-specific restriction endonuclease McrA